MFSSTRLLSLALLSLSALNAAAAPTPTKVPAKVPTNTKVPAAVVPPPAAAKAKAKTTTGVPAPRPTAGLEKLPDCASCIKANGHFDKVTFTCAPPVASVLTKVTTAVGCAQMSQMQQLFPQAGARRAGVIPQTLDANFRKMAQHVIDGDVRNPDNGGHVLSKFTATHPGVKPASLNNANKIQVFRFIGADDSLQKIKTVWDDGPGGYNTVDIKNMCVSAAQILIKNRKTGNGKLGALVMSPFGVPVCVTSVRSVACFPLGVSSGGALGGICNGK